MEVSADERILSAAPKTIPEALAQRTGSLARRVPESVKSTKLSPQDLYISPGAATSINTILAALRWGAVMFGLVFAGPRAANGEMPIVVTIGITIFFSTWRTIMPLRLGERSAWSIGLTLADTALLGATMGIADGFSNPLVGTLFLAVAVTAFGWGLLAGAISAITALVACELVLNFYGGGLVDPGPLAITALATMAILPGVALDRLLEIEGRRKFITDERNQLAETNRLLGVLNDLARTLPSSLDLPEAIVATRQRLQSSFSPDRVALLAFEDGSWSTVIQDGFHFAPEFSADELPSDFQRKFDNVGITKVDNLSTVTNREGSCLSSRLIVQNRDTGLIVLENDTPNFYDQHDAELLEGMADVLALTIANARSFNKLRSLAAAEERSRIARDLHDRLGQYLTYIAFELERINRERKSTELTELHGDVRDAIAEFRDTLLELRAAVSSDKPLSAILVEVAGRFEKRSKLAVNVVVPDQLDARLPSRIENEILRISQEALTNIEKHANASTVDISWRIDDNGDGTLTVADDGRGFDPAGGIRGNAYGLVGMRERAASIGALLTISSKPGEGTVIKVRSSGNN